MIKELESELSFPISSERPLHWIQVNTLSDIDKVALVERHLISETLAAKEAPIFWFLQFPVDEAYKKPGVLFLHL